MDLKNQLQEAKKTKADLVVLLKERIQYSEKLEKEIIQLRKGVDEKYIKSKFENNSRILDDILSSQRPSNDKTGLGYDKVKKPECSSFTKQGINKRGCVAALEIPFMKTKSHKYAPSSHNKDKTSMILNGPMKSRVQHIFPG